MLYYHFEHDLIRHILRLLVRSDLEGIAKIAESSNNHTEDIKEISFLNSAISCLWIIAIYRRRGRTECLFCL